MVSFTTDKSSILVARVINVYACTIINLNDTVVTGRWLVIWEAVLACWARPAVLSRGAGKTLSRVTIIRVNVGANRALLWHNRACWAVPVSITIDNTVILVSHATVWAVFAGVARFARRLSILVLV